MVSLSEKPQLLERPLRANRRTKLVRLITFLMAVYLLVKFFIPCRYHQPPFKLDGKHPHEHPDEPGKKHDGKHHHGKHHHLSPELHKLRHEAQSLVSREALNKTIHDFFLSGPHLSGQNQELIDYTRDAFESSGFETSTPAYNIWVNYPISHRIALLKSDGEVDVELKLEEPELKEDPTTTRSDRIPTFHGYSASGNVTGELVYANLGHRFDYDRLIDEGIDLEGKVVLARYGGLFRGLIVKFAEELGAKAVLIYSDPTEDGDITEANGYAAYPDGPARHPESVQRGSVNLGTPGDPTTPGFPSTPEFDKNRTDPKGIPGIPSIPISYTDALPLLKSLEGHGPQWDDWKGGLDVGYSVGPSKQKVLVSNEQDYAFRPNVDVIGRFEGENADEEIIFGNHRDAWILGGADPNSGSAVLLEVARILGVLIERGWKPKRTIVLASWDGEEYGLLGSTEWGEDNAKHLKKHAVAYINCDVGVSGSRFTAGANPLLRPVIERAVHDVPFQNTTLSKYWGGDRETRIAPLGSGSDFTVFQDYLGIPSLDLGFDRGKDDPVYHYHSNFDSYHWMQTFGDSELKYHEAITRALIVSLLEIVDAPLLPLSVAGYARAIKRDLRVLLAGYEGIAISQVAELLNESYNFLAHAEQFTKNSHSTLKELKEAEQGSGFWNYIKLLKVRHKISGINSKIQKLDQQFLYEGGLDDREWFKHVIYAPGRYTGYSGQVFPGIAEALEDKEDQKLIKWLGISTHALQQAISSL